MANNAKMVPFKMILFLKC